MKTYDEMLDTILSIAQKDERIRAVTMEGSNCTKDAVHDKYSDLDICYYVTDIREFTNDRDFMNQFGEILILQRPDDWYTHPYDYSSRENYTFLTQFTDGNRIDLTVIDISNIDHQLAFTEPRKILLNKDHFPQLRDITSIDDFLIRQPSEFEYQVTCNEFRWLSICVSKGLCREELYFAKELYDVNMMEMFLKMLNWKVAIQHDFQITTGAHSKYLKRYLSEEEMQRFSSIFPNGDYEDIWQKLFLSYDYFAELAQFVAKELGFTHNLTETNNIRVFLLKRKLDR